MRSTILVTGLSVGLLTLGAVKAQQPGGGSANVMALSAMDYIQIKQLVNRYAFALDTGSRNGYDYADLFSSDGVFDSNSRGPVKGRDQLAALLLDVDARRIVREVDDDAAFTTATAAEVDVAQRVLDVGGTRLGEALHDLRACVLLVALVEQRHEHGVGRRAGGVPGGGGGGVEHGRGGGGGAGV